MRKEQAPYQPLITGNRVELIYFAKEAPVKHRNSGGTLFHFVNTMKAWPRLIVLWRIGKRSRWTNPWLKLANYQVVLEELRPKIPSCVYHLSWICSGWYSTTVNSMTVSSFLFCWTSYAVSPFVCGSSAACEPASLPCSSFNFFPNCSSGIPDCSKPTFSLWSPLQLGDNFFSSSVLKSFSSVFSFWDNDANSFSNLLLFIYSSLSPIVSLIAF